MIYSPKLITIQQFQGIKDNLAIGRISSIPRQPQQSILYGTPTIFAGDELRESGITFKVSVKRCPRQVDATPLINSRSVLLEDTPVRPHSSSFFVLP
jgi:hypothetical protein